MYPVHLAAGSSSKECINLVLEASLESVDAKDVHGNTALHIAVMAGPQAHFCIQTLLERGANANSVNDDGATALHLAVGLERQTVELLIRYRANVNVQDSNGNTPLVEMAKHGNGQNLVLMLDAGADPST